MIYSITFFKLSKYWTQNYDLHIKMRKSLYTCSLFISKMWVYHFAIYHHLPDDNYTHRYLYFTMASYLYFTMVTIPTDCRCSIARGQAYVAQAMGETVCTATSALVTRLEIFCTPWGPGLAPWYPMVSHGIPWYPMVSHGPWCALRWDWWLGFGNRKEDDFPMLFFQSPEKICLMSMNIMNHIFFEFVLFFGAWSHGHDFWHARET